MPCECKRADLQRRRADAARQRSGLTPLLAGATFATFERDAQPDAYDAAHAFARDPEAHWLVLAGPKGTGKTHLLCAIVNRLIAAGRQPVYFTMPEAQRWMREGIRTAEGEERLQALLDCDVLILDDLGTEKDSAWRDQTLFEIVNHRLNWLKPLALSTNIALEDYDDRIASRLAYVGRSLVIYMHPGDYRARKPRPH